MKIILGSGSKSRKRILERAGFDFKIMTADIDEKAIRFDDPRQLVLALDSIEGLPTHLLPEFFKEVNI